MRKEYVEILERSFLFRSLPREEFLSLLSELSFEVVEYSRGEVIYSPDTFQRKIGFVVKGACDVYRGHGNGCDVRINTIESGGSFGIIGALSDSDEFPTIVRAKLATSILYLTGDEVEKLIKSSPTVSGNIIHFFIERIKFLNERIETFSEGSVEQKLAHYLLRQSKECGDTKMPFNKLKTAQALGVGRASLYRVLGSFSESKLIVYDNKYIQIIDFDGLERILK